MLVATESGFSSLMHLEIFCIALPFQFAVSGAKKQHTGQRSAHRQYWLWFYLPNKHGISTILTPITPRFQAIFSVSFGFWRRKKSILYRMCSKRARFLKGPKPFVYCRIQQIFTREKKLQLYVIGIEGTRKVAYTVKGPFHQYGTVGTGKLLFHLEEITKESLHGLVPCTRSITNALGNVLITATPNATVNE